MERKKQRGKRGGIMRIKFDEVKVSRQVEIKTADQAPSWLRLIRISRSSMSPPQPEGRPRNGAPAPKAFNGLFAVTAIEKGDFFELEDYVVYDLTSANKAGTRRRVKKEKRTFFVFFF